MLTIEEAIDSWKEFEARANLKRGNQIDRIKEDRKFLSGEQWDTEDAKLIDGTRSKRTINILGNSIAATSNVYSAYPFKFWSPDNTVDGVCDSFLKTGSNARAAQDVLYNTVAFGIGYFAFGSETRKSGEGVDVEVPALYSIGKVENVWWDPDSIEIDGSDAQECGICEYRSKAWVRSKYGDDWVTDKGVRAAVNTTENADSETMVIVTYYRMNAGKCEMYQMLNDKFLTEPVTLNISRLPVVPAFGERSWENDDIVWQGLVRKGRPIQKVINFCYTQLCERLAKCPKNIVIATPQAVEGYVEGYRNFDRNINPLLMWNDKSPDGKREYPAPVRAEMRVPFDDLTGIMSAQLELLSTITGVDAKGVMLGETTEKTATEVLYNERNTQTTVRHYYANLKCSFHACGELLLSLLGMNGAQVEVIQGPSDGMALQVARQELMSLMQFVPDDKRMQLVNGIFLTHPENPVLANVFGAINMQPGPTQTEIQQQQVIEQMKSAIEQKNQEIQRLNDTVRQYDFAARNEDKSIRADLIKSELDHRYKQEDMVLQARLNQGLDADKAAADVEKQQMELEKQAISLDTARVKAASDVLKTMSGLSRGVTKYED